MSANTILAMFSDLCMVHCDKGEVMLSLYCTIATRNCIAHAQGYLGMSTCVVEDTAIGRSRGPLVLTTREAFSARSWRSRLVAFFRLAASWLKKTVLNRVAELRPGSCTVHSLAEKTFLKHPSRTLIKNPHQQPPSCLNARQAGDASLLTAAIGQDSHQDSVLGANHHDTGCLAAKRMTTIQEVGIEMRRKHGRTGRLTSKTEGW